VRKLIIFVLLLLISAILVGYYSKREFYSFAAELGGEYIAYTTEEQGEAVFAVLGTGVYISDKKTAATVGEEIVLTPVKRLEELLLRFVVVSYHIQEFDGLTLVTGHSNVLDGGGNNIQIALSEEKIKIGHPALLGGY
jgi:hypothetical protein